MRICTLYNIHFSLNKWPPKISNFPSNQSPTTGSILSRLHEIDDSLKQIKLTATWECSPLPDIPSCIRTSDDKSTCLDCEAGKMYNERERECQSVILVDRGCALYGPYNSCSRCFKHYYLNKKYQCKGVSQPIENCHLYNILQTCSLCESGFALSFDKTRYGICIYLITYLFMYY